MDRANLWQVGGVPALRTPWNLVMLIPKQRFVFLSPGIRLEKGLPDSC